jgi:hypothetical protein
VRIHARIDRIDFHEATGEWAVFDYKTGEKADKPGDTHRKRNGQWIDLQLPLYRYLLPHAKRGDGTLVFTGSAASDVKLGYILLCGDPGQVGMYEAEWTQDDLAAAMDAARMAVRILRNNIYSFEGDVDRWASPGMNALMGFGRLVLEDDEFGGIEVARERDAA